MNCRKCGEKNSSNAQYCAYCGTPLSVPKKKFVNLALVIIIVLLLAIVTGCALYKKINSKKDTYSDDFSVTSEVSTEDFVVSKIPENPEIEEDSSKSEVPDEKPTVSEHNKKDEFLEIANEIEWYSENYLDTAISQSEMNIESGIVFEKWDVLLNEVYRYLKTVMSDSDFKKLQDDEIAWIAEKESAIAKEGALWKGGSGEIAARNMTAIRFTKDRCYYLISLIDLKQPLL